MWDNFFETTETVADGIGFPMYGRVHLLWLAAIALTATAAVLLYRKSDMRARRKILLTVAALTVSNEIAKYIVLGVSGNFAVDYLPLHLCSINIFVILAHAITGNVYCAEVLYAASLPAAFAALLFPSWTALPPTAFMHIHSFTVHTELMLYPLLLLADGFKPSIRRLLRTVPVIMAAVVGVFVFNKIFDTNFMFLNGAGQGNPLSFFESLLGDPLYLTSIPLLLAIVWGVLYGNPALAGKLREPDIKNKET